MAQTVHDFSLKPLQRADFPLRRLRGRPLLIVNTASQCGFTPQYAGLQALQEQWGGRNGGLVIIGVPSNDFGNQEPGDAAAIGDFCERNYGVTFAIMEKTHVKGSDAHPLFRWLGEQAGFLGKPRWNFYKYLTKRDGTFANWFSSKTVPQSRKLQRAIEAVV